MKKISMMSASMLLLLSTSATADERYAPIKDVLVSKECGSCHMAFQPQMLPARSWKKMMNELDNHFGEDASLNTTDAEYIKSYMMDNAADTSWFGGKFMRGVDDSMTPLRITKMPHWVHEHNEEVPSRAWNDPKVKSKANCLACHKDANRGNYDDD